MVSTRGVKLKFVEGERVLCYEPDPTKAKVLYDSKVLDVIVNKDPRGKRSVEYLIHFQGWNSSWDRSVREEYVLKDTAENRQLQKDLAEKAQLHLGAYLYRRERKKHNQKTSEPVTHSSEDGSSGSPVLMDIDDAQGHTSTSEDDSSIDDDSVPIELTQELRDCLEQDHHLINTKNKLIKLPSEPNIITILEAYWKHYATSQFCGISEKPNTRHRPINCSKLRPEDLQKNLTVCKEMLDGLRIYFDFTLKDLLLYKKEHNQAETAPAKFVFSIPSIKRECVVIKTELEDLEYAHLPNMDTEDEIFNHHEGPVTRRRGLRSNRIDSDSNGTNNTDGNYTKAGSSTSSSDVPGPLAKMLSWKLLPDHVLSQQPLPPSVLYGATHLARLLVKLPELLNTSTMTEDKLKILLRHIDCFVDFLSDHKEWFGDKFYADA